MALFPVQAFKDIFKKSVQLKQVWMQIFFTDTMPIVWICYWSILIT